MDGEIEYLLNDINRLILLLRERDVEEKENYLDEQEKNVEELKRLFKEKQK